MKRVALILIVVFASFSLFAGGKSCEVSKNAKNVALTGTLSWEGDNTVFHVANTDKTYTVCSKTASKFTRLAKDGGTVAITGKLVSCDETKGQELVIESAKKI